MSQNRRAIIEIGTNSVKLLVADIISGRQVEPIFTASEVVRLGRGVSQRRSIESERITRAARVVSDFAGSAATYGPGSIRVIATCAAREAANQKELVDAVERIAGLSVEVISGEQEAEWVFRGVTSDPGLARGPLLLFDVGGGSTKIIVGDNHVRRFARSFPLGTLRLLETIQPADLPTADDLHRCRSWLDDFINSIIVPSLDPTLSTFGGRNINVVGTGGSVVLLSRAANAGEDTAAAEDSIRTVRLNLHQTGQLLEGLWALPLSERLKLRGLPADRADTILTGAAIVEALMRCLSFSELIVSTLGVRYGALLDFSAGPISARNLGATSPRGAAVPDSAMHTSMPVEGAFASQASAA